MDVAWCAGGVGWKGEEVSEGYCVEFACVLFSFYVSIAGVE